MNSSYDEMMKLYDALSLNDKRNELSSLLVKTCEIVNTLLKMEEIENNLKIKNYNINEDIKLSESDMYTYFYEDVWNIKNKLLTLLIFNSSKNDK